VDDIPTPSAWLVLPGLLTVLFAPSLQAQTDETVVDDQEKVRAGAETSERRWEGALTVGGNANLTSNRDVVGQNDGLYTVLGLSINGETTYQNRPDEFRGLLTVNETYTRTPDIGEFVKNTDSVDAEGVYNRYLLPWSGGFGRLAVETTIFDNYNVTGSPRAYRIVRLDGSESTRSPVRRFQLSDPFQPTSLNQSAGVFANPYESTPFTLRSRLGLGARETFATGVLVVDDDPETSELDVRELESVYQAGLQAFLGASGAFPSRNLTYEAGITGLLPVFNNDRQERSALELTRIGVAAGLTFGAFEWLSSSYRLEVTRDPQLIDAIQVQHNVLLTLKYDLISRRDETSEPTAEEKLDEAQKRIESLEERIQELEANRESDDGEPDEENGEGEETSESSASE